MKISLHAFPRSLVSLSVACSGLVMALGWAVRARAADPVAEPIRLNLNETGPTISPLLFGFNLEHTRYSIWKGLNAQLLANRKFAGPNTADGTPPPQPVRGVVGPDGVVAHWYGVGKSAAAFAPDTKVLYTGTQSQQIRVSTAETGGIGQADIPIHAGTSYVARFQLRAEPSVNVTARLCDASGQTSCVRQSFSVERGDWREWGFEFDAPQTDLKASLEITFEGPGTLWVGSASLLPADNFHGMRRDVVARLEEMSTPLLRWPGGNFTRDYRWKDGLLPLDKRPPIVSTWHETLPYSDNIDFYDIGIDECMALCRELKAEPCITATISFADGAQQAADWVEYCNGSAETRWGKIRADRGYQEPYHVKYWTIGNEVFGDWMGPSQRSVQDYPKVVAQYSAAMKKVDPSVLLIVSGLSPDWDKTLVKEAGASFDLLSRHDYSPIATAYSGPAGVADYRSKALRPRDGVLPLLRDIRRPLDEAGPEGKRIGIAFDEWNLWHDWFTRPLDHEWHVGPIDGVFAAAQLNMLSQEAAGLNIPMAEMFEPVNEGCIKVQRFSAELSPMGQVFALYQAHHGARLLKTDPPRSDQPIDVCASLSADARIVNVTLVNRAAADDVPLELSLTGSKPTRATATILSVKELKADVPMDRMTWDIPVRDDGRVSFVLPRFGIALLQITLEK